MSELERFKTEINLGELAAHYGYAIDRRDSGRVSVAMRRASDDDKVVISRGTDGHWVYFSVRDANDNGTVIDFIANRTALSFGRIRQELRPWIGKGGTKPNVARQLFASHVEPTTKDRAQVLKALHQMPVITEHPYLLERGITPELLQSSRFRGKVLTDARCNAVFPHVDRGGFCGYEQKNRNPKTGESWTGFSPGGTKGLWFSHITRADTRLVVTESAIDALSFHALHPHPETRYASTGGSLNPTQPELLSGALQKLPEGGAFLIATDADTAGRRLAENLAEIADGVGRADLGVQRVEPPEEGQDWNDQLRAKLPQPGLPFSAPQRGATLRPHPKQSD